MNLPVRKTSKLFVGGKFFVAFGRFCHIASHKFDASGIVIANSQLLNCGWNRAISVYDAVHRDLAQR